MSFILLPAPCMCTYISIYSYAYSIVYYTLSDKNQVHGGHYSSFGLPPLATHKMYNQIWSFSYYLSSTTCWALCIYLWSVMSIKELKGFQVSLPGSVEFSQHLLKQNNLHSRSTLQALSGVFNHISGLSVSEWSLLKCCDVIQIWTFVQVLTSAHTVHEGRW